MDQVMINPILKSAYQKIFHLSGEAETFVPSKVYVNYRPQGNYRRALNSVQPLIIDTVPKAEAFCQEANRDINRPIPKRYQRVFPMQRKRQMEPGEISPRTTKVSQRAVIRDSRPKVHVCSSLLQRLSSCVIPRS